MRACPTCHNSYGNDIAFCPRDGSPLRPTSGLAPGSVIRKKYEIISEIGRGGMGVVYLARHLIWNEQKALKVLSAETAGAQQGLKALMAEALVMRQLQHPNIVRVEDADYTEDDQPFLVMEYVEGQSLRERLQAQGRLAPEPALRIAAQTCSALSAAHQKGIVHRDIKPQNLLLAKDADGRETVKVIDFGIAKVREDAGLGLTGILGSTTGLFVCTPAYASPEQAQGMRGGDLDGRADLYALGVVLFEMLTGKLPFSAATPEGLLWQRLQAPPLALDRVQPGLTFAPEVAGIVAKALERERENRYRSAEEMERAMEAALGRLQAARERQEQETVALPTPPPSAPKKSATTVSSASPRLDLSEQPHGRRAKWLWLSGAVIVAAAIIIAIWPAGHKPTPAPVAPAVVTQPAQPPPSQSSPDTNFDVAATLRQAAEKRTAGQYDDAIKLYQSVLARDPANREARRSLSDARAASNAEKAAFGQ